MTHESDERNAHANGGTSPEPGDDLDVARDRTESRTLSPSQRLAVEALAAGRSQGDAAKLAGVTRGTVVRWLRETPGFASEVERTTRDLASRQRARLLAVLDRALDVVGEALDDDDPGRRDRAAALVLRTTPLDAVAAVADGPVEPDLVDLDLDVVATDDAGRAVAARVRARLRRSNS